MTGILDMALPAKGSGSFFEALESLSANEYESFTRTVDTAHSNYSQGIRELSLRSGFSIIMADNVAPDPKPKAFSFKKSPMVLSISLSGHGVVRFAHAAAKEIHIRDNDLYIGYAPNCCGETISSGEQSHSSVMLMVDPRFLRDLYGAPLIASLPGPLRTIILQEEGGLYAHSLPAPPQAVALADRMLRTSLNPELFKVFACSAGLEMLCVVLDHLQDKAQADQPPLSREDLHKLDLVRQRMENDIVTPPSMQELCREVGMNEFKLKRGFKQAFGTTVFGHLQRQRVKTAYLSLVNDGKNVSECAWDVGYTNVSHFISAFKKHFGVTPGAVAKGYRVESPS